ncbi:MAG: hypothetical protein M3Q72_13045 [Actinomycetota bacterium]|nr:hypothetical protein [Actinomycetota bacterium]
MRRSKERAPTASHRRGTRYVIDDDGLPVPDEALTAAAAARRAAEARRVAQLVARVHGLEIDEATVDRIAERIGRMVHGNR